MTMTSNGDHHPHFHVQDTGNNSKELKAFFDKASSTYTKSANTVTDQVIEYMVETYCSINSAHPITSESVFLDNACGPGTVTTTMLNILPPRLHPRRIQAADISYAMISQFNDKRNTFPAHPDVRMSAQIVDGQNLTSVLPEDHYTHIFMTFAIYSLPDAVKGINEMYKLLKPGGICMITSWVEMGFMQWYGQAQSIVRPDLPPFQGLAPMYWRDASNVRNELVKGGFADEKVQVIPFNFGVLSRHFPDRNMMGGMINMITKGWDAEDKKKFVDKLEEILIEKERVNNEQYGGKQEVPMIALIGIGEK